MVKEKKHGKGRKERTNHRSQQGERDTEEDDMCARH